MLKRFSTEIAKRVAKVAGAKPPRTLKKKYVFYRAHGIQISGIRIRNIFTIFRYQSFDTRSRNTTAGS